MQILHNVALNQKFASTLLVRREQGSCKSLPSDIIARQIDFAERSSIVGASEGNNAMIVFTSLALHLKIWTVFSWNMSLLLRKLGSNSSSRRSGDRTPQQVLLQRSPGLDRIPCLRRPTLE
jgi:hypothetical protein